MATPDPIEVHMPANLFYPELPGGCLQYFRYGPFLKKLGVHLHVHTVRKPHHPEESLEVNGIQVTRYTMPGEDLGFLGELEFLTERALERIGSRKENVCLQPHGTTAATLASISRLWKARLQGIPSCFHFTMVPTKAEGAGRRLKELAYLKAMLSPYRKLLMCSRVMGRAFEEAAGISSSRIEPIPNGIDLSIFQPVTEERKRELREELGLPAEDPVVLYVGSVISRKGVDILVKAWSEVAKRQPRAKLVLVGSTRPRPTVKDTGARTETERYVEEVGRLVESLSDPGSVVFAGETDEIRKYYQASDLFAFASYREGLPSVILEAMACAIPCVTAPFVGLPDDGEEYGTHGEHIIRSAHEPGKMAEDICRLLEQPEDRIRMGRAASQWIRSHQEMGGAAERLASVYREMVGAGHSG